ncbi:MAG TPA: S-methyl-5-thioribose-1-phosphate isomerase [Thermodesulfobacteriota bacterium]|jgi:methylthioribose-1-phosphate isomerase|nr:S-methyl-5-thioribose-1-phosphate isomerase [Thermodesulfobacteriota bacterium]
MEFSPLFWPVELKGETIAALDETKLPQRLVYLKIKNYQEACQAIKSMKTRAIGQVLLVFYTFLLHVRRVKEKKKLLPTLTLIAKSLNATRPTLPFKFLTDMVLDWGKEPSTVEKNIKGFLELLKAKRIEQAQEAGALFEDGDVILTHCNVSGLLPLMGEFCRNQRKRLSFFATETRPYFQGSRLTAWELQRAGFNVTIIPDSAVAQVFAEGLVNKVITGADQLARNGDIANKIGTYQIALLARNFKIPFYVLAPPPSNAKTGKDIAIEIRPDKELLTIAGQRIAPKEVKGYYPAFDITPAALITKHIYLRIS